MRHKLMSMVLPGTLAALFMLAIALDHIARQCRPGAAA